MDTDSVDTLFSKIATLENYQKELKEKLSKIEKDIENKKLEKLNEFWSKEEKRRHFSRA